MKIQAIPVRCRTNIDEYKNVDWPREFAVRPEVGDSVEGRRSGPGPGSHPKLVIVQVTHVTSKDGYPILEIELHKGVPRG